MRIRFLIRDLLWLVVVAALATGWWLEHRNSTSQLNECLSQLRFSQSRIAQLQTEFSAQGMYLGSTSGPYGGSGAIVAPKEPPFRISKIRINLLDDSYWPGNSATTANKSPPKLDFSAPHSAATATQTIPATFIPPEILPPRPIWATSNSARRGY